MDSEHPMKARGKHRGRLVALSICCGLFGAVPETANAGIPDTPLPRFSDGTQAVQVMAVPGVVKRSRIETDFLCTSFEAEPVHIGVEVFNSDGTLLNDVNAGVGAVLNVSTGETVTIGTSGTAALLESVTIPIAALPQGSARVVASSDGVRCNVIMLDDAVTPPNALATLGEGVIPQPEAIPPTLPLPQFGDGSRATHTALFPATVKRGRLETDFFCTSLATTSVNVGVEILGPDGDVRNDVSSGNGAVVGLLPGRTVTFGTSGTAAFLEDQVIATGGVAQGAARLVSTSGAVACTAFVLDAALSPPTSIFGIAVGLGTE